MNRKMNKQITSMIQTFVEDYPKLYATETTWRTPVTGFADAEDSKFQVLKQVIGSNHAMPQDILPKARSVIVFFLPFSEEVVKSNLLEEESSRAWDIANIETNQMIVALNRFLYDFIEREGFHASLLPPTYNYDGEKLISDWSHKSAVYIAGIGKFGVHHVLITSQGCCGRIGSVITDMKLEPTEFKEEEYCLYQKGSKCKACVKRCPNEALTAGADMVDYDRYRCNEQIYEKLVPEYTIGVGDACGKCMCGTPCSLCIP